MIGTVVYRVMQNNKLLFVVAFLILCPLRAGAELLEPLADIYWQNGGGIFSDEGQHQYEEEICSVPEDFSALQEPAAVIADDKPVIAIVIDDMGLDRKRSARAVALPPQVTLAYLPYSPHIRAQTKKAKDRGHELMVHLPMAPERKTANPGPNYLSADLSPLELHERIVKNLDAFEGYAGVNNHMGSAFTQSGDGMGVLMAELKLRSLIFLDSKTVPASLAEKVASAAGVQATHRDVFIDHFEDGKKVEAALAQIERMARRTGSAVAIGHPKDVTLAALEKWLPGLEAKGFRLAPLSEAIAIRHKKKIPTPVDATVAKNSAVKEETSLP